jgi:ribonuclease HII
MGDRHAPRGTGASARGVASAPDLPQPVAQPILELPSAEIQPRPAGWRCCGLDEVGRGALAGPLVAAAVILPADAAARLGSLAVFLRDSKTVPAARREQVAARLAALALHVELAVIPVDQINARGIGWANREAFRRLIGRIAADEYVVDGRVRPPAPLDRAGRVRCLVDADAQVPAVSAASLVAKVYRDALMRAMHDRHPAYAWEANVGYGTPAHLAALRVHGACEHHRQVFVTTALGRPSRGSPTDDNADDDASDERAASKLSPSSAG